MTAAFADKVAFVTGGASGIGRAVSVRLAGLGATVVVADVAGERASEVAASIQEVSGGRAIGVGVDVADAHAVEDAIAGVVSEFGALHLAVNNAGMASDQRTIGDASIDHWNRVIAVNLSGVFHCLRSELPAIVDSGGGAVVNVSSIYGSNGREGSSSYVAAKHGVIGLTKTAALEYAASGVRINAVGPGYIETPLLEQMTPDRRAGIVDLHPQGRLGRAEEVADLIVFLLSSQASFIQGSYHLVDGGYSAR